MVKTLTGIPPATVSDHIKNRYTSTQRGRKPFVTKAQQTGLANELIKAMYSGVFLSQAEVVGMLTELAGKPVSSKMFRRFLDDHNFVKRKGKLRSTAKAKGANSLSIGSLVVNRYFALRLLPKDESGKPVLRNYINIDETSERRDEQGNWVAIKGMGDSAKATSSKEVCNELMSSCIWWF